MNLIWQIVISVLLAFLLLCIISIIDFNRWYGKDKEVEDKEEENPLYKLQQHNPIYLDDEDIVEFTLENDKFELMQDSRGVQMFYKGHTTPVWRL